MNRACVHHWHIEMVDGPTAKGTCQVCGEVREFLTMFEHPEQIDRESIRMRRETRIPTINLKHYQIG